MGFVLRFHGILGGHYTAIVGEIDAGEPPDGPLPDQRLWVIFTGFQSRGEVPAFT